MFPGDTRNKRRSGQSLNSAWRTGNQNAGAQQHATAEGVGAAHLTFGRFRGLKYSSGGSGWNWRGLYNAATTYGNNDCVQLGPGTSGGLYLSTMDGNTNPPDSGIGWVQLSSFATWL